MRMFASGNTNDKRKKHKSASKFFSFLHLAFSRKLSLNAISISTGFGSKMCVLGNNEAPTTSIHGNVLVYICCNQCEHSFTTKREMERERVERGLGLFHHTIIPSKIFTPLTWWQPPPCGPCPTRCC